SVKAEMTQRKPIDQHILHGSFRSDRHGDRADALQLDGTPQKPRGLGAQGRWLWELIISAYADKCVLAKLDTAHMWMTCEMWQLYRKAVPLAKRRPSDKAARTAVLQYAAEFERCAGRLGLTPADRLRIHRGADQGPKGIMSRDRTE